MVSAFIYTYYPNQQEQLAIQAIDSRIESIASMFSIGVGIGMGETDLVAVSEALEWANSDSAVVYISVVNPDGFEIASFNSEELEVPSEVLSSSGNNEYIEKEKIIYYKSPIKYQNIPFGTLTVGYSLVHMEEHMTHLKKTTLYFCLALLSAGFFVSIIIANRITGNIRRLDNAIKAISSGAKNTRVRIRANDEIGKLANAFNEMLDNLEKSQAGLVSYSEQLKKHNEELNQFSYVVSHDLKAPLRAIHKLAEWIEEDIGDDIPEDTKKNLMTLRGRVFRMESLINGLLEYSKIGRSYVSQEEVDTGKMINNIIDLLDLPSHINSEIQADLPKFTTKKILLYQVFINLIANAIKYNNKSEGIIRIQFREKGEYYEFTVEDNGMGIEEAYHKKIFVIFQTLEARDQVEGTGIGLSIVKKIIDEVGGQIMLKSEKGKGATFTFTWPKKITSPQRAFIE